ncbi:hypothetical protein NBT05_01235 [Aquimarina sp. ERC-38]|uniref:hypothetical protein n=1 Tax=Aquimarina sp. ERC-38 TaxID=2949996 RepID=UPI0022465B6A|nr:hypothetical protein [Aquimarina sp. ERC-38]UZO81115.1 hypothetical protein NBT05_01235 [Aquimarina sp. ERC-38]
MGVFDSLHEVSENAIAHGNAYVKVSKAYYKLKTFKILAKSASTGLKAVVIGGLFLLGFIFLIVSGTLWLAVTFDNYPLAFLITAFTLFLLGVIGYLLRGAMDRAVIKTISKDFFEEEHN